MKKSIIIICIALAVFSFFAFNYINNKESETKKTEIISLEVSNKIKENIPDFIYEVGPRFSPIKKGNINNNLSITYFLDAMQVDRISSIESIEIIIIENDEQTNRRLKVLGNNFSDAQINLLKSFNYSDGFKLKIDYKEKHFGSETLFDASSTPHHTIVPETQAEYIYGKNALIKYFKDNTETVTQNVVEEKLKPAKLYFTVTKDGSINNIRLDNTSGYIEIDELMLELINTTPGGWIPATNIKGENVNQELVVSFGLLGC
ncbi:hypothetical protein [uncultured Algibacter sp.]|uniref:hypothetical protein n=1 Tax=uncultured Algibacter sp. TaxID=298659 RepID=UPI00261355D8|nr:hypothetical protein [uncultured Algibacter sp.]